MVQVEAAAFVPKVEGQKLLLSSENKQPANVQSVRADWPLKSQQYAQFKWLIHFVRNVRLERRNV